MIQSKKDYKFFVAEDTKVNIRRDNCSWWKMLVNVWYGNDSYRFLRYMKALRKYEYELNCSRGIWGRLRVVYAKVCWHRIGAKYNVNINPNTVGYGFRVPHLVGGVILNCEKVGNYCTANAGVIVGNNSKGGMAVIGDHVDLSIGCKVIGGVRIGNNAIVAPNSVVVKDVPDNAIVTGIPAHILKYQG